jgi:hypothetical protein
LGYDRRLWDVINEFEDDQTVGIEFEYVSTDGEENYPGNLTVCCFNVSLRLFTFDFRFGLNTNLRIRISWRLLSMPLPIRQLFVI